MGTERVSLVLLASPLLGPAVWGPVGERLTDDGWDVVVAPVVGAITSPEDVLARLLPAIPADVPVLLVPHSNAGLYVAALAETRDVRGVVFVDAGMPADGPTTPTAPAELRAFLATLADDAGLLPVWTRWWADEDLEGLFPDARARAAVESEQVRLPLTYFDGQVPSPGGWRALPAAYLAFGDTYAAERAEARQRGWPVTTLEGGHLHLLADPVAVSAALEGLVGQLGFLRPR